MLQMPERLPEDSGVGVSASGADHIIISVDGNFTRMSRYNAWRVFGMLALILGIRLPSRISKTIKL